MIKRYIVAALLALTLLATGARGAGVEPDPDFSIDIPNDWERTRGDFSARVPAALVSVFECVDGDSGLPLLMVGWKPAPGAAAPQAAFCVSYRRTGGGKTLNLLKATHGGKRDEAFGKFADIFASKIHGGYKKRGVSIEDMAADLLSAAENVVMVLDGKLKTAGKVYMRSDTVILHKDAILNVSTLYDVSAPSLLNGQTDAIPMSVKWKQ